MPIEVEGKSQIDSLLKNKILTSLLKTKRYDIDANTWIDVQGDLTFTLSMPADRLIITCNNIQPRLTAKRFFKFQGRVTFISIGLKDIVIGLDGLPDVTVNVV